MLTCQCVYNVLSVSWWANTAVIKAEYTMLSILCWPVSVFTLCCLFCAELILQLVYTILSVSWWADTTVIKACVHCAVCFVLGWNCSYQCLCALCCLFRTWLKLVYTMLFVCLFVCFFVAVMSNKKKKEKKKKKKDEFEISYSGFKIYNLLTAPRSGNLLLCFKTDGMHTHMSFDMTTW